MTTPLNVILSPACVEVSPKRLTLCSSETLLVIFILDVPYLFFCARAERLAAGPAACVFFGARAAAAGPVEARVMR